MSGPAIFVALLEITGLSVELLYGIFVPGKSKWARRAYFGSAILLFAAVVSGLPWFTTTNPRIDVSQQSQPLAWIPASLYILFVITFFLLNPILKRRKV